MSLSSEARNRKMVEQMLDRAVVVLHLAAIVCITLLQLKYLISINIV